MKKAKLAGIKFNIASVNGYFSNNGWRNRGGTVFDKKTSAMARANLIYHKEGQVYIKVRYGKTLYNNAICVSFKEIKEILSVFTEKPLTDYALEGK